ncbi:hypothetical protein BKA93DRAFT_829390 [Sparassis latifolia]
MNSCYGSASSSVIISFPSGLSSSGSLSFSSLSTVRPTTSISINSQFSFVTQSSLLVASLSSTSATPSTLTNPDQPTSSVEINSASASATASPSAAALPSGLAARIYPLDVLPGDLSNYTLISILFGPALNWPFVVNDTQASAQIFAWGPAVVYSALAIPSDQVMNYALQAYEPTSYEGPADVNQLGTIWLAYIPTNQVSTLAQQIKVSTSPFYTAAGEPYIELAAQVNPSFELDSVPSPNSGTGGSSASNSTASTSNSSGSNSRKDAIIGVVSSLGAIALLVLAFLIVRAVKQRRELAHRRLSDPVDTTNDFIGARPEGQEFDRDSLGGQRRRSFYYAADSLRGFADVAAAAAGTASQDGMRERRTVMPGMISAPVLRDNTMSW